MHIWGCRMQIEIYDLTINGARVQISLAAVCDSFSSLLWDVQYYGCGNFEVYIAANARNIEIFQTGRIIGRDDDKQHYGIIESVTLETDAENGDYLTVTGRFLMSLLSRRIIYPTLSFSTLTSYADMVRLAVYRNCMQSDNRQIPGLRHGSTSGTCWEQKSRLQVSYENLMEWIFKVCEMIGGTANIRLQETSAGSGVYTMMLDLYTVDFLRKKRVVNNGVMPQYYIEGHHEPIIPKELFLKVQEEIARRGSERDCLGKKRGFSSNHCFSQMVYCAECGEQFRRIHWNNRGKKSIVWRCTTRLHDKEKCRARTASETLLQEAFLDAVNEMLGDSSVYLKRLKENLETAIHLTNPDSAEALAARMAALQQELIDRTSRRENYDDLAEEILHLREVQAQTVMDDAAKAEHKKRIRELRAFIRSQPHGITEFDETLVKHLVERVTVFGDYLVFRLKSGVEVVVEK